MATPQDPLKRWGWLILTVPLLMAAWVLLPYLWQGGGEDAVSSSSDVLASSERGLRSLDPTENPQGSPGRPIPAASSAYGGGRAEPREEDAAQGPAGPGRGEAAFQGAAQGRPGGPDRPAGPAGPTGRPVVKTPDSGSWGDKEVKTGFSAPRRALARLSSLSDAQGAGSSGALSPAGTPFGRGGDPGYVERGPGLAIPGLRGGGRNGGLEELKRVQRVASGSLSGAAEAAAGYGKKAFDAAPLRKGLAGSPSFEGSGVVEGDVPVNLKANDPRINSREFEPPAVGPVKEVEPQGRQAMEQQLMMMLLSVAIGGVLGPAFGAIGGAIVQGMISKPPKADGGSGVGDQIKSNTGGTTSGNRGP